MDKKKAICEYLRKNHIGKGNAIHSKELEKLFMLDGRNIRRKISSLRQDGFPICSDESGYYYADNQKEINNTVCRLNELCEHNGVAFRDHFVSEFDEYEMVKKENPDAIVMYKVGDFFEIYGERDTQIAHDVLELMLTRKTFTNKSISTPMCGFPVHVTEQYTQRLLDAGNDVVAVTHEPGEKLEVKRIVSTAKAIDTPPIPVGRIEYLGSNGEVGETVEYTDAERFERDIKDENYYGTPMSVVVYRNADGNTIPHDFIFESDPPLQGFSIENSPLISKPYIDHYYVVEDLQAVPLEIKTFSERDKAINEYFSLPTNKVKAFGVMNTNELPGSLDFIQCKKTYGARRASYVRHISHTCVGSGKQNFL